jgi:hypothetical protein
LSERADRLISYILANPYQGLFEVMDRLATTSEPLLDAIGYYNLSRSLRKSVYAGMMTLSQIYDLSQLPEDVQTMFWERHRTLTPEEFHEAVEKVKQFTVAASFLRKYGCSVEDLMRISQITKKEAEEVTSKFFEAYSKLCKSMGRGPDVDL